MEEFYRTYGEIISKVDNQIESLNKKDKRRLLTLIRSYYVLPKASLDSSLEFLKFAGGLYSRRVTGAREIIALYEKAGVVEEDWRHHWSHYKADQIHQHHSMSAMAKPERQDNKTFINRGSGGCNANKIRFPKKARKTAWKRFYRLFPHLKPQEVA
jgi:hypothetical protein